MAEEEEEEEEVKEGVAPALSLNNELEKKKSMEMG